MKSNAVFIEKVMLSFILFFLAFWFARTAYSFFNPNYRFVNSSPKHKELIDQCHSSETLEEFGLYRFTGNSATTSDSWSVYYKKEPSQAPRLIFYAYSSPVIKEILCESSAVVLLESSEEKIPLPLSEINTLVESPIRFYKGDRKEGISSSDIQNGILCSSISLALIVPIFFFFRRKKA